MWLYVLTQLIIVVAPSMYDCKDPFPPMFDFGIDLIQNLCRVN